MAITDKERAAYEKGQADAKGGFFGDLLSGITLDIGRACDHGYTGSEKEAYDKGLTDNNLDD